MFYLSCVHQLGHIGDELHCPNNGFTFFHWSTGGSNTEYKHNSLFPWKKSGKYLLRLHISKLAQVSFGHVQITLSAPMSWQKNEIVISSPCVCFGDCKNICSICQSAVTSHTCCLPIKPSKFQSFRFCAPLCYVLLSLLKLEHCIIAGPHSTVFCCISKWKLECVKVRTYLGLAAPLTLSLDTQAGKIHRFSSLWWKQILLSLLSISYYRKGQCPR